MAGTEGLASQRLLTDTLFNDIISTQHASAHMVAAMDDVHAAALSALATRDSDRQRSQTLTTRLSNDLIPLADADLAAVQQLHAGDDAAEKQTIANLTTRWHTVRALWNSMVLDPPESVIGIARIDDAFVHLNQTSRALVARESRDGRAEYIDSEKPYRTQRSVLVALLLVALLAAIAAVAWLYRDILPRTRRYSAFAEKIADGGFAGNIDSRGTDELAVLGRTLDEMATRRQRERNYDLSQTTPATSSSSTATTRRTGSKQSPTSPPIRRSRRRCAVRPLGRASRFAKPARTRAPRERIRCSNARCARGAPGARHARRSSSAARSSVRCSSRARNPSRTTKHDESATLSCKPRPCSPTYATSPSPRPARRPTR